MSTVGTAVSRPSPRTPCPPARPIGVVSDKIYPYFIADARPMPPRVFELIIRYPFVALRSFLHPRNAPRYAITQEREGERE